MLVVIHLDNDKWKQRLQSGKKTRHDGKKDSKCELNLKKRNQQ